MPVGAIIGAGASLGGAALQSSAAKKAAKTQARAAREGYELAQENLEPFMAPGRGAVASLAELYGINPTTGDRTGEPFPASSLEAFRRSPDYEFARTEGLRGVEFSNAAKGALRSGNNLRGLTEYASGLATQNFSNYRGALERLAAIGQNSAGALAGAGQQSANMAGAATASGTVGSANAWAQGAGNIGNYAMLNSLMKPPGSAYGGFGGSLGGFGMEQNVGIPLNLGNNFIPPWG